MQSNEIGPEGAIAIADALKINTSIKELNLWKNKIGPEGAIAIADALKINTSIEELNLKFN